MLLEILWVIAVWAAIGVFFSFSTWRSRICCLAHSSTTLSHALPKWGFRALSSKLLGSRCVSGRTGAWLKTKNPNFQQQLISNIANAELDRLITELGRHPLAERELREVKEAVFVSLNRSQPEVIKFAFWSQFRRTNALLFQESGLTFHLIRSLRRETDLWLPQIPSAWREGPKSGDECSMRDLLNLIRWMLVGRFRSKASLEAELLGLRRRAGCTESNVAAARGLR